MSLNVANCPRCGKLYMINAKELCGNCIKEIDLQYERCGKFLRDNRGSTMQQVSDATEVPVKQIIKFIREGRISIINAPNMSYPCEICGIPIRDQHICDGCRQRLAKDLSNRDEDLKRMEDQQKKDSQVRFKIQDRLKDRLK